MFLKANSNDNQTEFKLKRSDSLTDVNSLSFFKLFDQDNVENENGKNKNAKSNKKVLNLDQVYLRICFDCGRILEKKYKSLKDKIVRPIFDNLYDVLCFF
jgi:hypothetical protein